MLNDDLPEDFNNRSTPEEYRELMSKYREMPCECGTNPLIHSNLFLFVCQTCGACWTRKSFAAVIVEIDPTAEDFSDEDFPLEDPTPEV